MIATCADYYLCSGHHFTLAKRPCTGFSSQSAVLCTYYVHRHGGGSFLSGERDREQAAAPARPASCMSKFRHTCLLTPTPVSLLVRLLFTVGMPSLFCVQPRPE